MTVEIDYGDLRQLTIWAENWLEVMKLITQVAPHKPPAANELITRVEKLLAGEIDRASSVGLTIGLREVVKHYTGPSGITVLEAVDCLLAVGRELIRTTCDFDYK